MSPGIISKDDESTKKLELHVLNLRKKYGVALGDNAEIKVAKPTETKKSVAQPAGSKIYSGLTVSNSKYYATSHQLKNNDANVKDLLRDLDKTGNKLKAVQYKTVEEPGVIPRTLSEVEAIVSRINKEEQPRIEKILDTTNGNLSETQQLLQKLNKLLGDADTGGLLRSLQKYDLLLKIGLGLVAVSFLATIVLIPVLLLRIIIFGL